jgi:hypothetical protein
MKSKKQNVFEKLKDQTKVLQDSSDELQQAFETLARSNGSGDPIRRKLKRKLSKPAFIQNLQSQ